MVVVKGLVGPHAVGSSDVLVGEGVSGALGGLREPLDLFSIIKMICMYSVSLQR